MTKNGMAAARRRRSIAVCAALCISGCAKPDGAAEFRASQRAMQQLDHLAMEWTTRTPLGTFTETAEFDCGLRYYHYKYVKDLTEKGIEDGSSMSQGRPRAHQEEERLFVSGHSLTRFSGGWENPANDNARPWSPSPSYDPTEECESIRQGKDVVFVPFKRILESNRIVYRGKRIVDGFQCHEFEVTYPDVVYSDKMKTVELGRGSSYSEREQITAPVQSIVCLGVTDLLPRAVAKGDLTVKFSYGLIVPLSDPAPVAASSGS